MTERLTRFCQRECPPSRLLFIFSLMYSFDKYLLSTYWVSNLIWTLRNILVSKYQTQFLHVVFGLAWGNPLITQTNVINVNYNAWHKEKLHLAKRIYLEKEFGLIRKVRESFLKEEKLELRSEKDISTTRWMGRKEKEVS